MSYKSSSAGIAAILIAAFALVGAGPARAAIWQPAPGTTWQIQFSGPFDPSFDVQAYDIDGFETPAQTVADLHTAGRKAICYIDAGSWERWRPDAKRFPPRVLGRALAGWPGERWLDVRRLAVLAPIIKARVARCVDKGFDAVDFDNVDGYRNRSGFPLTGAQQLRFDRFLAKTAHDAGLAAGLKNDLNQIPDLVGDFDFAVNEQCLQYDECDRLLPFIDAGKAVLHIEYTGDMSTICASRPATFSTVKKHLNLDSYREACP